MANVASRTGRKPKLAKTIVVGPLDRDEADVSSFASLLPVSTGSLSFKLVR